MYRSNKIVLFAPAVFGLVMSFTTFTPSMVLAGSQQQNPSQNFSAMPYSPNMIGDRTDHMGNIADIMGDRTDYDNVTLTESEAYSSADEAEMEYMKFISETSEVPGVKVESGGTLTLTNSYIDKTGDTDDRENSGFYGFNVGVLASSSSETDGYAGTEETTTLNMSDCTITTDAVGANGAFAFGEDAVVNLDHVTINTTGDDNSRGIDATYGGTVNITNSVIDTEGDSCAALATDRYMEYNAPSINADNVIGTTAGSGSPGLYCTGTFTVSNSTTTATGSEAAAIEGYNSITLINSDISGAKKWGVIIYQSMSMDSSVGTGTFDITGGSITNNSDGPMFLVCDTTAEINLKGTKLINPSSDTLLWATSAAAGSEVDENVNSDWGSLGGTVIMTATDQTLKGDIDIEDESSSIDLTMYNTKYSGAINPDNVDGVEAAVSLDKTSSWNVTGTSYLSSLSNNGKITGPGTVYVSGTQYYP